MGTGGCCLSTTHIWSIAVYEPSQQRARQTLWELTTAQKLQTLYQALHCCNLYSKLQNWGCSECWPSVSHVVCSLRLDSLRGAAHIRQPACCLCREFSVLQHGKFRQFLQAPRSLASAMPLNAKLQTWQTSHVTLFVRHPAAFK